MSESALASTSETVRVERSGSTWTLTLNRPEKRNALNADMVEALHAAVSLVHAEAGDVLVLRAEGKSFCAGFDFSGFEQASEGDLLWRFVRIEQLLQTLQHSPCLTVALAQGPVFGAGVDLLVSCKRRIAQADASFRMPGLKFGLVLGTRRLAALIGAQSAREIQEVAATLSASEALSRGLLSSVAEMSAWPDVVSESEAIAAALEPQVRANLYRVLTTDPGAADLADLVHSVVGSAGGLGLKARIAKYLAPRASFQATKAN
jgi:enoyl-CoA hydratase